MFNFNLHFFYYFIMALIDVLLKFKLISILFIVLINLLEILVNQRIFILIELFI